MKYRKKINFLFKINCVYFPTKINFISKMKFNEASFDKINFIMIYVL